MTTYLHIQGVNYSTGNRKTPGYYVVQVQDSDRLESFVVFTADYRAKTWNAIAKATGKPLKSTTSSDPLQSAIAKASLLGFNVKDLADVNIIVLPTFGSGDPRINYMRCAVKA